MKLFRRDRLINVRAGNGVVPPELRRHEEDRGEEDLSHRCPLVAGRSARQFLRHKPLPAPADVQVKILVNC